ncbi:MAG: hypothetical protein ACP5DY_05620 [Thermovirgaceae bacterium]
MQDVEEKGAFPEDLQGVFAVGPDLPGPGESRDGQKGDDGNLIEEDALLSAKSLVAAVNIVNKYAGLMEG